MNVFTRMGILLILFLGVISSAWAQLPIDTTAGWSLVWQDEFDYPDNQLEQEWTSQNGPTGNAIVLCSRWRENAEVHDGILELKAVKETRGGQDWTCGSIWTKDIFQYGYYECRYKYAGATATNNSFWLWPRKGISSVPPGQKATEFDVNEGHYPNVINTNIHNRTDTLPDGTYNKLQQERIFIGALDPQNGYTYVLDTLSTPIQTRKIRFSSTHSPHFHIGEFRIFAPNAAGYPTDPVSETADMDVPGLVNYTRDPATTFAASGQLVLSNRNTDPQNVGDGEVATVGKSWIAQPNGLKWLEITLDSVREIGAVQLTNGWRSGNDQWNALIKNFKLSYWRDSDSSWVEFANYDTKGEVDFSEEYHRYGFLWTKEVVQYFYDDSLIRTIISDTLTYAPSNIYLSLAILANDHAGPVVDSLLDGKSMKVDYVRVYTQDSLSTQVENLDKVPHIYPNPVREQLNFRDLPAFSKIKIYNQQGQLLLLEDLRGRDHIPVSTLSPGLYYYGIESREGRAAGSFIKD